MLSNALMQAMIQTLHNFLTGSVINIFSAKLYIVYVTV